MNSKPDPLTCSFEDAARNHLRDGIRMSTNAKMAFFEEMLDFAWRTGAIKTQRHTEHADETKDE